MVSDKNFLSKLTNNTISLKNEGTLLIPDSSCGSKLVDRKISSMRLSGFTRVTSTRACGAPSSDAFLRLSSAAFARSSDPVSLNPDPELGFLEQYPNMQHLNSTKASYTYDNAAHLIPSQMLLALVPQMQLNTSCLFAAKF